MGRLRTVCLLLIFFVARSTFADEVNHRASAGHEDSARTKPSAPAPMPTSATPLAAGDAGEANTDDANNGANTDPANTNANAADADTWYRAGLVAYEKRDFDGAISAFRAAYALQPRPVILFAEAQTERRRGDCSRAIGLYQQFLATEPTPAQVQATAIGLRLCVKPATPIPPQPVPSPQPRPWYRDGLGAALVGTGAVFTLTGAALLISADSARDDARNADNYLDFVRRTDDANWLWNVGMVGIVVGAACAAGGIGRLFTVVDETSAVVGAAGRF